MVEMMMATHSKVGTNLGRVAESARMISVGTDEHSILQEVLR